MLTRTRLIIEITAGSLLFVGVVGSYIHSREVAVQADAEQKANQVLQTQLQQMRSDVQKEIAQRDAQYQQDTKSLQEKFDLASKNNAQMLALVSQIMKLPVPVNVTVPTPTKENPNPTPVATVQQANFPAVEGYVKDCEQCKLDRDKARADLESRLKDMELAQKEIDGLKNENTQLVKATHGTFWRNLKKSAKWAFIGAVAGGVALGATGHIK